MAGVAALRQNPADNVVHATVEVQVGRRQALAPTPAHADAVLDRQRRQIGPVEGGRRMAAAGTGQQRAGTQTAAVLQLPRLGGPRRRRQGHRTQQQEGCSQDSPAPPQPPPPPFPPFPPPTTLPPPSASN